MFAYAILSYFRLRCAGNTLVLGLVKPDVCFEDEDSATAMATSHLDTAFAKMHTGGSPADIAISLRHEGYKKLDEFRVVRDGISGQV